MKWAGLALGVAGTVALVECFARFALKGLGTPAPVAPTEHLVVTGLYRHVRNPMYVAVLAIILAQGMWFASIAVLIYAGIVWAAVTAFVVLYEEPTLARTFGEEYAVYRTHVGAGFRASPPGQRSVYGVHHGRSGRSPAPPRSSGLTASTWCSWIPPFSKASRDPAMYRPHTFAAGSPTSATASSQCSTRLAHQSRRVSA